MKSIRLYLCACIMMVLMGSGSIVNAQDVFVSPTGDDANNGLSTDTPVQSFQKAADIARSLGANGIIVEFKGGTYTFDSTVILNASYSGITFRAATDEIPVFTSLKQVTNWSTFSGSIMKAAMPSGINHVRYLQDVSEDWMERSASESFSTTELAGGDDGGCIECNNYSQSTQPDMANIRYPGSFSSPNWAFASQYDLRATTLAWHQEILPIASASPAQNRIFTSVPGLYDLRKDAEEFIPKAWVLNSIEGINSPGEWASINGEIYLFPKSGTDDIYVPALTELIRIDEGTEDGNSSFGTPVTDIVFEGITFTGGDFRAMQSDDVTAQHDWMVVDEPDALLRIRNAADIIVRNCTFEKSGGTGVRLDRFAQRIQITNNRFSYLGRGGINVSGRGPGYGDVSKYNEISYNYIERIGMEKWASIAILLDNSSNNHVHHNYITNTYFTGIAAVGPRQLMFAAQAEGVQSFYTGREFHFREMAPHIQGFMQGYEDPVLIGSQEAMRFVYNYNNRIEENALIDVSTGQDLFINGQIYISGSQRSTSVNAIRTNFIERNYMYDSFEHSVNDYAMYSDSDQDAAEYIGNMINGVHNADNSPEPLPLVLAFNQWAESETQGLGQITLRATLFENTTSCNDSECSNIIGVDFVVEGTILNGVGGTASFVDIYKQMKEAIDNDNFPQVNALPGAQAVRNTLDQKIGLFVSTEDDGYGIPGELFLSQNYPNPFNPSTNIRYGLHKQSEVKLEVYDLLGRKVSTLVNAHQAAGRHVIEFDASSLSSGIYIYRLQTEGAVLTRKLTLIK